jgi:uncharacterized protein (DUF2147 family)
MLSSLMHRQAGFLALGLAASALAGPRALGQSNTVAASQASDLILGEWWTEGRQGRLRFTRDRQGLFRGTTTCCVHKDEADSPSIDRYNPKPNLRTRSTVGIVLIWKLKYEDGEYVDGYVYNPRDGKTYRIEAKVIDQETLKIRGYMGISLFGQNQIWKRAHLPVQGAPPAAAH